MAGVGVAVTLAVAAMAGYQRETMASLRKVPVSAVGVSRTIGLSLGVMLACTFNSGGLGQTGGEASGDTGSGGSSSAQTGSGGPTSDPSGDPSGDPTNEPTSMGPAGEASATGSTGPIDPDTTATTVDPSATTVEPMTSTTVEPGTGTSGDDSSSGGGTTGCAEKDFFKDGDGDGYGDDKMKKSGCEPPDGYVDNSDDCDDKKAGKHPGADEVCGDGDNDCDGVTDEFDPESNAECGGCKMFLYPANNRVYYFCSDPIKHWAEAKGECEKRGGFLAKDINTAHHDWLVQQLPNDSGPWWIGGQSPGGDSKFNWLDGTVVPVPDPRWAVAHPVVLGDDRMVLISDANTIAPWNLHNGRWYDRTDMDNQPYICESDYMQ